MKAPTQKYLKILLIAVLLFLGILLLTYRGVSWQQLLAIPVLIAVGVIGGRTKFI